MQFNLDVYIRDATISLLKNQYHTDTFIWAIADTKDGELD